MVLSNCVHLRCRHACFFLPFPPNFTLSRQFMHFPHSVCVQPVHCPHRLRFVPVLSPFQNLAYTSNRIRMINCVCVCMYLVILHLHVPGLTSGVLLEMGLSLLPFANATCSGQCTCNDAYVMCAKECQLSS